MQTIPQTEQEWKDKLTPEQYQVMREKEMEIPYTGEYLTLRKKGTYTCAGCGTLLFSSKTKYDYGSGWPCFGKPEAENLFEYEKDTLLGTEQTGVYCRTCKSHLGHVFEDGPELKGEKRYCINSCALVFKKDKKTK